MCRIELADDLAPTRTTWATCSSPLRFLSPTRNGRIDLPARVSYSSGTAGGLRRRVGKQEPAPVTRAARANGVEIDDLAGVLLIPEQSAVEFLQAAKANVSLASVEDLRDASR